MEEIKGPGHTKLLVKSYAGLVVVSDKRIGRSSNKEDRVKTATVEISVKSQRHVRNKH